MNYAEELSKKQTVSATQNNCKRCGKAHTLAFGKLINPTGKWTHWAMCPNVRQPLFLRFKDIPNAVREAKNLTI